MNMTKGKLLVISGLSAGAGKDSLRSLFLAKHPDWQQPLSTTTRGSRLGEEHSKQMSFVTKETFEAWKAEGKFLETDFHADNWYGTLREPVETLLGQGKNVLLRIDVNGALQVKRELPEALVVFVKAESFDALEKRMIERGHTAEEIKARLKLAKKELELEPQFENVVVNETGKLDEALAAIEAVAAV